MPAPAYNYAPAKTAAGGGSVVAIIVILGIVLLICPGILLALLLPAVGAARAAARRASSTNNLRQITLAMHMYHDTHRSYPPAVVTDAAGQPLYSGRVLLLPYLEQQALYNQWDRSQAWDSPANMPLAQTTLKVFQDPAGKMLPGQTDYLFVTGSGTAQDPAQGGNSFDRVTDGLSNTLFFVETANSGVNWAEPRDFDASQPVPLPPGNHAGGNIVATMDGAVHFLSSGTPPDQVHAMTTSRGGESVMLP